jgi:hypothetical protein
LQVNKEVNISAPSTCQRAVTVRRPVIRKLKRDALPSPPFPGEMEKGQGSAQPWTYLLKPTDHVNILTASVAKRGIQPKINRSLLHHLLKLFLAFRTEIFLVPIHF